MDEQPLESQDGGEDSGDHLPAANTKKTTTKDMDDSKSPPQVSGVSAKSPCSGPQEKSEEAAPAKQQYEDAKTTENSASADNTAKPNNTAKTTAAKSPRSSRPSSSRRRYANPAAKTQAQNNAAKEADAKITPPRTEKKRTRTRTRSSARKSDGSSSKEVDKDPPAASKDHHTVKPDTPNQPSTKRGTAGTKDASRSAAARSTPSSTNSSSNSAAPKKKTQSPTEPQGKSNKRTAGLNGASSSQPSAPVGISKLKNASGTYAIPENLIKARSYHEKTSISEMIRRVKRLSAHIIYLQIMLASEENYQETASDEARNCRAKNLARVLYTLDSPCQSRKRTRLSSSQRQNLKNLGLDCFGDDEDANLAQNRDTRGMFSLSSDASTNTDYSCSDRDSGSDYSIDLQDWRPALSVNRRRRPGLERAGDKSAPGTEGTSNTESDATSFEILDRLNVALTEFQEKFDKDSKRITSRS